MASKLSDTAEIPQPYRRVPAMPRPLSSGVTVESAAASHSGLVRPQNEDHYLVVEVGRYLRTLMTNLPEGSVPPHFEEVVFAMGVADGMGGQAAGEVASRLAISLMVQLVLETPDWIFTEEGPEHHKLLQRTADRFQQVNAALLDAARQDPQLFKMGTTLTVARSLGSSLIVAHVGDSRAYLFRQGRLRRLTEDHTFAQALANANVISSQDVASNRFRHLLTQSLGMDKLEIEPDLTLETLADGDRLLLCTDGLSDMTDDDAIQRVLGQGKAPRETCEALVQLALDRGGKDNITVALADYAIRREAEEQA